MKKGVAAAALVAALALAGCSNDSETISGSVESVVGELKEAAVDEVFQVEVTGYIVGGNPASDIGISDDEKSVLNVYPEAQVSEWGFIKATFPEPSEELNEIIAENESPTGFTRVTVTGTSDGDDYGSMWTMVRNCEIKFD